jgi:hypothetical protein
LLAIRYLADGFSPHHFKLMTKTDKIGGKESRLRNGSGCRKSVPSPWAQDRTAFRLGYFGSSQAAAGAWDRSSYLDDWIGWPIEKNASSKPAAD